MQSTTTKEPRVERIVSEEKSDKVDMKRISALSPMKQGKDDTQWVKRTVLLMICAFLVVMLALMEWQYLNSRSNSDAENLDRLMKRPNPSTAQGQKDLTPEKTPQLDSAAVTPIIPVTPVAKPILPEEKLTAPVVVPSVPKPDENKPEVQFKMAQEYYEKYNYTEAIRWLSLAAQQHHVGAQMQLGTMYLQGQVVKKDLEEAFKWLLMAAKLQEPDAQYLIATMYMKGQGVDKDEAQGSFWMQQAATHGIANAQYEVARMYEKGIGIGQNQKQALSFYAKAALQGHKQAQDRMAIESKKHHAKELESQERAMVDNYLSQVESGQKKVIKPPPREIIWNN